MVQQAGARDAALGKGRYPCNMDLWISSHEGIDRMLGKIGMLDVQRDCDVVYCLMFTATVPFLSEDLFTGITWYTVTTFTDSFNSGPFQWNNSMKSFKSATVFEIVQRGTLWNVLGKDHIGCLRRLMGLYLKKTSRVYCTVLYCTFKTKNLGCHKDEFEWACLYSTPAWSGVCHKHSKFDGICVY